jgi:hypothetical protein
VKPVLYFCFLFVLMVRAMAADATAPAIGLPYFDDDTRKMGVMDATGQVLAQPLFDEIGPDHDGLMPVRKDGKWGFMLPDGTMVVKASYRQVAPFHEGFAQVCSDDSGEWGFIDVTGAVRIPTIYDQVWDMHQGHAMVEGPSGKGRRIIDAKGKIIFDAMGRGIMPSSDGLIAVRNEGGWGFLNLAGDMAIAGPFDDVSSFSEGLAAVKVGGKYGFIDVHGSLVIPATFDYCMSFSGGLAAFSQDKHWGFIDSHGTVVIPPTFSGATDFSDDRALVSDGGKQFYITGTGAILPAGAIADGEPFDAGYARVIGDGVMGYIDPSGKWVISVKSKMFAPARTPAVGQGRNPKAKEDEAAVRAAAEKGDPAAQFQWARILRKRLEHTVDSPESAARWTEWRSWLGKAAQSEPAAMAELGYALIQPDNVVTHVERDPKAGVALLQQAVKLKNSDAMWELGIAYVGGRGVAQDFDQARGLFQEAADAGNPEGYVNLGEIYMDGTGVKKDDAEALKWLKKARDTTPRADAEAAACMADLEGSGK